MDTTSHAWTQAGPGWWTHPEMGGICRERRGPTRRAGWYRWPPAGDPIGPFGTLAEAFQRCSECDADTGDGCDYCGGEREVCCDACDGEGTR